MGRGALLLAKVLSLLHAKTQPRRPPYEIHHDVEVPHDVFASRQPERDPTRHRPTPSPRHEIPPRTRRAQGQNRTTVDVWAGALTARLLRFGREPFRAARCGPAALRSTSGTSRSQVAARRSSAYQRWRLGCPFRLNGRARLRRRTGWHRSDCRRAGDILLANAPQGLTLARGDAIVGGHATAMIRPRRERRARRESLRPQREICIEFPVTLAAEGSQP